MEKGIGMEIGAGENGQEEILEQECKLDEAKRLRDTHDFLWLKQEDKGKRI